MDGNQERGITMKFNRDYRSMLTRGAWIDKINRPQYEKLQSAYAVIGSIVLGALLLMIPSCAQAQDVDMAIIAQIESSNNTMAYNKTSQARGLYQITPVCLADYNEMHNVLLMEESLFGQKTAYKVANWYMNTRIPQLLKHFKHEDTLSNRLTAYNCGISCVDKPLPTETKKYIEKYKKLLSSATK